MPVPSPEAAHRQLADEDSSSDEAAAFELLFRTPAASPSPDSRSSTLSSIPDNLEAPLDEWHTLPLTFPGTDLPSFRPILGTLLQHLQTQSIVMAQPYRMPPRGGAGAPSFDPNNDARSIIGFFEDLEYNFQQAGVNSPREKKAHAVRYAPDSEKAIWKSYPEFSDPLKSYDDFKKVILAEYIGEGGRMLYTLRDLDMLVGMTSTAGMHSIKEFNDYSRKFRDIASFLVTGSYLRKDERDQLFLQGISEPLRSQVLDRLRITHPNVLYPRQQYSLAQVTEAVRHVLEAAVPSSFSHHRYDEQPSTTSTTTASIKSELSEVTEALKTLTNAFIQSQRTQPTTSAPTAFGPSARQLPPHMGLATASQPAANASRACFYCGDASHAIRRCPLVETDIAAGLVKRNDQYQVVLPSGSYVPAAVQGATLHDRVLEYYRLYPEARTQPAPAAPQLMLQPVYRTPTAYTTSQPSYLASDYPRPILAHSGGLIHNVLDPEQRIDSLRQELYALERQVAQRRSQNTTQDAQTGNQTATRAERAQRRQARFREPPVSDVFPPVPSARVEEVLDEADVPSAVQESTTPVQAAGEERPRLQLPTVKAGSLPSTAATAKPSDKPSGEQDASQTSQNQSSTSAGAPRASAAPSTTSALPEHPYANARDATYVPPQQRNFGAAPPRPTVPARKPDPAYRTLPPIHDARHAANVFRRCLENQITLSQEELLSIAPEVRQATREVCSTRRVAATTEPVLAQDLSELPFSDELPALSDDPQPSQRVETFMTAMPVGYEQAAQIPPPGSLVLQDPYELYLRKLPPDEDPVPLRVSLESAAIRAIEGVFMNRTKVSCILDSGSAIVSMSEGVCHALGLDYDHRITLEMQSANGDLDNSLGLARNVPVRFGSLVVYLQFHVIRSPAYDVLLGRPFDILTSSIVQTNPDGSQTITLHDPNSDIETTIPTHRRIDPQFPRGPCNCPHCVPGFYSSRM